MITQDQLKDVVERTESLYRYLEIDKKKIEFEEEDLRTKAPDFWDDPKRAEEQMKKVKTIKKPYDYFAFIYFISCKRDLIFSCPCSSGQYRRFGCCNNSPLLA